MFVLCKVDIHWGKIIDLSPNLVISLRYVLYPSIENCWFGKLWSIFVLETRKMSYFDFINSSIEMNLFLKELTLRWLIVMFLCFLTYNFFTSEKGESWWVMRVIKIFIKIIADLWDRLIWSVFQNWLSSQRMFNIHYPKSIPYGQKTNWRKENIFFFQIKYYWKYK